MPTKSHSSISRLLG